MKREENDLELSNARTYTKGKEEEGEEVMLYFRKRPIVIKAVQNVDNPEEVAVFFGEDPSNRFGYKEGVWSILTLEGVMDANPKDWIIQGIKGEYYPCKPDIFAATYEEVPCP